MVPERHLLAPALVQLQRLLDASGPAALAFAAAGKKILGYTCPLMPEELPHALGLHPIRLTVALDPPGPNGLTPEQACCAWERALLFQTSAGRFGHLWGVVFSCNTCEAVRALSQGWRGAVKQPGPGKLYDFRLPLRRDGDGSWQDLGESFQRLKRWLEHRLGKTLRAGDLESSARIFNRIRASLRGLRSASRAGLLTASAELAATIAVQTVERGQAADLLELANEQLGGAGMREEQVNGPKLMILGGPLDSPRLLEWLDRYNAVLTEDDSCSFSHYSMPEVDLDPDRPWEDMILRHRRRSEVATSGQSTPMRLARMLKLVEVRNVDGVVFLPIKGCDPQKFDNAILQRALEERAIPHLTIALKPGCGALDGLKGEMDAFFGLVEPTLVTQ